MKKILILMKSKKIEMKFSNYNNAGDVEIPKDVIENSYEESETN